MSRGVWYRRCVACGEYHHIDETILLPEHYPEERQSRFCLACGAEYTKGLIREAELRQVPLRNKRRA